MANHKSAKKRVRQTLLRTEKNKMHKSQMRTVVKQIREAIKKKDKDTAVKLLPSIQKVLAKLSQKGIMKKNAAARRTSRLASQISRL